MHTLQSANLLIGTCPTCRTKARVIYEPGCTFAKCLCGDSFAEPDFAPLIVARRFNAGILRAERRRIEKVV